MHTIVGIIRSAAIVIALVFSSGLAAAAAVASGEVNKGSVGGDNVTSVVHEASIWKKVIGVKDYKVDKEGYFAYPVAGVACFVVVRNDGSLQVSATDSNWYGKIITEIGQVHKNGSWSFSSSEERIASGRGMRFQATEAFLDNGYLVFQEQCAKFATKLPSEVVKKFHGAFGIK